MGAIDILENFVCAHARSKRREDLSALKGGGGSLLLLTNTSPIFRITKLEMPLAFVLPTGYPWVLAAASGITFVNIWQILLVSGARKRAGIRYPQVYATKEQEEASKEARIFNCTQRAHANTLENVHIYVYSTLVSGLGFPRLTVGLAAVHLAGRVLYTLGYSTGDPAKRRTGATPSTLALLTLVGTSTLTIFNLIFDSGFQI